MWLQTSCDLTFDITMPTPFILMLRPRSGAQQWVAKEVYKIQPSVQVFEFTDNYSNLCQQLVAPPGPFSIHTSADIKTADSIDQVPGAPFIEIQYLPNYVMSYLLPSRYCESDRCGEIAISVTSCELPGYDQVAAIESWLRETLNYSPGSSEYPLSAMEFLDRKSGVCRDFAHLGIALCRSLSIPARMVVGYLHNLEPMDLHAWFEAYVGDRWYTFDAVHKGHKGGYVAVGYGRDAVDVAIYNQFGPAVFPTSQFVKVACIDDQYV